MQTWTVKAGLGLPLFGFTENLREVVPVVQIRFLSQLSRMKTAQHTKVPPGVTQATF